MIELSQAKQKEARKQGVSVQVLLMADLVSIGYSEADAYTVAYQENAALSAQQNKGIRERITSATKFRALVESRQERNSSVTVAATSDELLDKAQTAQLIMNAAMKQPADSKERIEGLMKYSDLMGYKKEDTGETKDSIMFAFPIKCYQCPLLSTYNEFRKQDGDKELRPVEMERIIRLADGKVKKAEE